VSGSGTADDVCRRMRLLIQADLDGELEAAEAAAVAEHVAGCPRCAGVRRQLAALQTKLRAELPFHAAPPELRARLERGVRPRRPMALLPFGAGFAVAACLALLLVIPRAFVPSHRDLAGEAVAGHIRALQPGHLLDVTSSDQHTVKPWFDGRLDYAPPVKDLAADGFPLTGARLDYLDGRPVAALVYRRARHIIDLFVWPGDSAASSGEQSGYNYVAWSDGKMTFWAISDLNLAELREFTQLWRSR
jgi:anti-sigma factor RsiW